MGAYSPVPDMPESLSATLLETIHLPILAELARRGMPFRGALYAGLMLTPEGPVLLEFNARFGDPEAQAILPRLAVPLGPLLLAAARGDLAAAAAELRLRSTILPTTGDAAVAIVLAAAGYPESPRKGDVIDGLDEAARGGATVFHAGTVRGRGRRATAPTAAVCWRSWDRAAAWPPPAPMPREPRPRSPGTACSAATTSPPGCRPPRPAGMPHGGAVMIPRYTLPEMGAVWTDEARFGQMLRVEIAVARAEVGRGMVPAAALTGHRVAGPHRRRSHRRDREDDRPRRHRLRQPGGRDGRRGRPLPAPGPDQQRRRRHRAGAAAPGRRPPARWKTRTRSSQPSSLAPGPRPAR